MLVLLIFGACDLNAKGKEKKLPPEKRSILDIKKSFTEQQNSPTFDPTMGMRALAPLANETLPVGTLVISMDNTNGFSYESYGLAVRLLHAGVPLKWIINTAKTGENGIDLTAQTKPAYPTASTVIRERLFKTGPIAITGTLTAAQKNILTRYAKGSVRVYEITTAVTAPVFGDLIHKPKAITLGDNGEFHTTIFAAAGLDEGVHYDDLGKNPNAAELKCATLITTPHTKDGDNFIGSVRTHVNLGRTLFAQCAGVRMYAEAGMIPGFQEKSKQTGLSRAGFGNVMAQFSGILREESGSLTTFDATGQSIVRVSAGNNRAMQNKNIFMLGSHKYIGEGKSPNPDPAAYRMLLNALLYPLPQSALTNCPALAVCPTVRAGTIQAPTATICIRSDIAQISSTAVATITTGSGTIQYKWQIRIDDGNWQTAPGISNTASYNPPADLYEYLYTTDSNPRKIEFRRAARGAESCEYVYTTAPYATYTIYSSPDTPGSISGGNTAPVCNLNPGIIQSTAPATGGWAGATPLTYLWEMSINNGVTWTTAPGTNNGLTYDPPLLERTTQYRRRAGYVTQSPLPQCFFVYTNVVNFQAISPITNGGVISAGLAVCGTTNLPLITSTSLPSGNIGGTIEYQWQTSTNGTTWNNINGATSSTYDPPVYGPPTVMVQFRRGARVQGCPTYLYSNISIFNILTPLTSGGTVSTGGSFCGNTDPNVITNVTNPSGGNGGALVGLVYQWQISINGGTTWTDISEATTSTYNPPLITQTTLYRRGAKYNNTCGNYVYSNTVTFTVNQNITNAGTIIGGANYCGSGDPDVISSGDVAIGGIGSTIEYQWQSSTNNGTNWSNISGATTTTYDPANLTQTTSYRRGARRIGCPTYLYSNVVTFTVNQNVTNAGTIIGGASYCGSGNPGVISSSAGASGGTGSVEYQWQSSTDGVNWSNITSANATTYDPANLTQTTSYRRGARRTSCPSYLYTNIVTFTINPKPAIPQTSVDCSQGFSKGGLTVTAPTGAGFEYKINTGTYQTLNTFSNLANGNYIVTVKNSSGCETTGSAISVNCGCSNPPTVSLNGISQSTCGTTAVTVNGNTFGGSATGVTLSHNGAGILTPTTTTNNNFSFTYLPSALDAGKTIVVSVTTDNPIGVPCTAANQTYDIVVNALPAVPIASVSCIGGVGAITITSPLGGDLQYSINNGVLQTLPSFAGVSNGNYTIRVKNVNNSCEVSGTAINVNCQVPLVPKANSDAFEAPFDKTTVFSILSNDGNSDGTPITNLSKITPPIVTTAPTKGTVVVNNDGSVSYTPNANTSGTDTFIYRICDKVNTTLCDTALVTIALSPATPMPPIASNDIANTPQDKPVTGNVLTNDDDPQNSPLTVSITPTTPPSKGNVTLNPNGTFTYTPNAGVTGEDKFCYEITNGFDLKDGACVTVEIVPTPTVNNEAPVAADDNTETSKNTPVVIIVKANDSDPEGQPLGTPTKLANPTNGTAVINFDGTASYTPNLNFVGKDSFTYSVCDTGIPSKCDTATVTIIVKPTPVLGNQPPVAVDDATLTNVSTPVSGTVAANDFDPDHTAGQLTYIRITTPTNGTVLQNANGTYTYTPSTGYIGSDSYTYSVCDPLGKCDTATVSIAILPATPQLVANPDNTVATLGLTKNIPVLTNDKNSDGTPADLSKIILPVVATQPTKGIVSVKTDGTIGYTPNAGTSGTDTFIYRICDKVNTTLCDTALVTIYITSECPIITNAANNNLNPTGCNVNDGSIKLCGLIPNKVGYVLSFTKNNAPQTPVTFTADASGCYTISGLGAGSYSSLKVSNPASCPNGSNIHGPVVLVGSVAATITKGSTQNPSACGAADGFIQIGGLIAGIQYTLTYEKNSDPQTPITFTASGALYVIQDLTSGAYSNIKVSSNGCASNSLAHSLVDPVTPTINVTAQTNPTLCSGNDGSFTVSGLAPSSYTLYYTKNGFNQTSISFTVTGTSYKVNGLTAGAYTNIRVVSSSCVSNSVSINLVDPSAPTISLGVPNMPSACGKADGSITITGLIQGIVYTLKYQKDGVLQTPITLTASGAAYTLTGLDAAIYSNINVNQGGCVSNSLSQVLSDPGAAVIAAVITKVPTSCGANDGSITVSGLTTGLSYTLNYVYNGVQQASSTFTATGTTYIIPSLQAGTYTGINVTQGGCTSNSINLTLNNPGGANIDAFVVDALTCDPGNDGAIIITGLSQGVTYTLTYSKVGVPQSPISISNSSSTSFVIRGLTAANYTNIVVNQGGCLSNMLSARVYSPIVPATPVLSNTSVNNVCPATTADLSSISSTNNSGLTLTWHSSVTASAANLVPDPENVISGIYYASFYNSVTKCFGLTTPVSVTIRECKVCLSPKAFLQGALFGVFAPDALMRDDLRTKGYLPTTSPYLSMGMPGVTATNTTTVAVVGVNSPTGNNAIVDWVFVELRDKNNPTIVVDSRSALIQRDGDIVDVDGVSTLQFNKALPENYYVSVKHRNHLGVMSKSPIDLTANCTAVDFRLPTTPTYTISSSAINQAQVVVEQGTALWAGNALYSNTQDSRREVIYQGTDNDINVIYQQVINASGNLFVSPSFKLKGYFNGDINLNGEVIFQGTANDVEFIYQNIIKNHSGNVFVQPFFKIREQAP